MKKLSFIMSLVLVFTALVGLFAVPTSAATYKADTVATVNGVEVTEDTILDALLACPTGGVVEIVKDFEAFSLLFQNGESGITSKWVVNGNGKTITSPLTNLANANYLIVTTAANLEINNLTLVTYGSGINVKDGSQVTLNNVNVYSGGTKAGTTVEDAMRPAYAAPSGSPVLNSIAVNLSATTRSTVFINGGVFKAYGVSGQVLAVNRGNMVVTDGYFVGEDCSFVARVQNQNKYTDLTNVTASLTVYGGTFIKPVTDRSAGQYKTDDATKTPNTSTDGCVIRGDAGGLINIHGGTFANFSGGKSVDAEGNKFGSARDFVILGGISTNTKNCVGFINIFGGDFYSFMTSACNESSSQLIGNYSGSATAMNDGELTKINTAIYGGNFYSTLPTREDNIKSVVDKAEKTIQHVPADQYSATTNANQTVTVYGKEFTGVTKWSITYNQPASAPTGATVKVTNSDNKTYYISDYNYTNAALGVTVTIPAFVQAINAVADRNSTVTLLSNLTIAPTEILARGQTMTIDGNNKTITSATSGLTVSNGNITIKNLTINASTEAPAEGSAAAYALKIAKTATNEENPTVDAFKLNLKLENCSFNANVAVVENEFLEGSVSTTGCQANGSTLNINVNYTAPEPQAPECHHDFYYCITIIEPTHLTTGIDEYVCDNCGETEQHVTSKLPGHTYDEYQKYNIVSHKLVCDCGESIVENHAWNAGQVITPATHTEFGTKKYTCIECGETTTENIPKIEEHSQFTCNKHDSNMHKRVCECGYTVYEAHTWNAGQVITPATHTEFGTKKYTCIECGETTTENIPKIEEHSQFTYNKHDSIMHNRVCECGYTVYEAHTWNDGEVIVQPTHTTVGSKKFTCTICSETKTEDIAKLESHTHGEWQKQDDVIHTKTCECGNVVYAGHVWDEGTVTTEATLLKNGVRTYVCEDCGFAKTEDIKSTLGCRSTITGSFGGFVAVVGIAAIALRKKKETE